MEIAEMEKEELGNFFTACETIWSIAVRNPQ
jgi:hypothetical protein